VLTSGYQAEYGRSSGLQSTAVAADFVLFDGRRASVSVFRADLPIELVGHRRTSNGTIGTGVMERRISTVAKPYEYGFFSKVFSSMAAELL
jgi:hypothetical protein